MGRSKKTPSAVDVVNVEPEKVEVKEVQPIKGEIVPADPAPLNVVVEQPASTLIPLGSLMYQDPKMVIDAVSNVAKELVKIVDHLGLFKTINGRKFVFVDGWETLGGMLGVSAHEESSRRLEDGSWESVVVLKRNSDGGVIGRGSAICGTDEKLWSNRDEYAKKSMATTRATGKAYRLSFSWIMKLAGYEGTPAEEMEAEADAAPAEEKKTETPLKPVAPYDRPLRPRNEDAHKVFGEYAQHLGIPAADVKSEVNQMLAANGLKWNSATWEKLCAGLEAWCKEKPAKEVTPEPTPSVEPTPVPTPETIPAEPVAEDPTDGALAQ